MANRTERADLLNEIELMKLISEGNHLHIVNMIGCVTIQEPIQLCMTIIKHGDLLKFLQYIRQNQLVSIIYVHVLYHHWFPNTINSLFTIIKSLAIVL